MKKSRNPRNHKASNQAHTASKQEPSRTYGAQANAGLKFDNFVTGKANQLAAYAARCLVELEMDNHNPLFIYGESGTGTTHLASAIANLMKEIRPQSKIGYCHATKFVSDVVHAFQTKNFDQFRQFYSSLDLLIIDELQLLAAKPGTQQELRTVLSVLLDLQKRVVITSNILPKDFAGYDLDPRLIRPINGGLVVRLGQPDLELRIAILKQEAKLEGCALDEDVVLYIANNVKSIPELKGALNRVVAYSRFHNCPYSLDTAREALLDIFFEAKEAE